MKRICAWLPSLVHLATLAALVFPSSLLPARAAQGNTPASTDLAPELRVADKFLLAIPKAGFGKEYLFTVSLIPQAQAATSTGLALVVLLVCPTN